jgi:hypothetical protein
MPPGGAIHADVSPLAKTPLMSHEPMLGDGLGAHLVKRFERITCRALPPVFLKHLNVEDIVFF